MRTPQCRRTGRLTRPETSETAGTACETIGETFPIATDRGYERSSARELGFLAHRREPRGNFFPVIALDFDRSVLRGSTGAAVTLERFRGFVQLCVADAGDDAHGARAPLGSRDSDNAVVRNTRAHGRAGLIGHAPAFGRR